MAYRRRQSAKKSSGFKIQTEKAIFANFMNDIPNCLAVHNFPNLKQDLVQESSERIFSYCYSFREDSPFTRGLNYNCKEMGFYSFESQVIYTQFLPGIAKAYLMGEFNNFSKDANPMQEIEGEPGWFKTEFCASLISEGSALALRVIDSQGTEYNMIPPSCQITLNQQKGVYLKYRKSPLLQNPLRARELLAYEIDVEEIGWKKLNDHLKSYNKILERFNTIILRNVFDRKTGLLHRYSIDQSNLDTFEEAIQYINIELGAKVALEWNFEETDLHYLTGNPVEKAYSAKQNDKYQFAYQNPAVLSYILSVFSYFKNYFNIDGFFLNGIDALSNNQEGVVLIKCIGLLKDRLSEHGIIMSATKSKIPAVCQKLLDGGMGVTYSINTNEKLDLTVEDYRSLIQMVDVIKPHSNCLEICLPGELNQNTSLNLILTYLISERGVFCSGPLSLNNETLRRVLKLRTQSEIFEETFKVLQVDEQKVVAERGRSLIFFNYCAEPIQIDFEGVEEAELIFNSGTEEPVKQKGTITLSGKSCVLLEKA